MHNRYVCTIYIHVCIIEQYLTSFRMSAEDYIKENSIKIILSVFMCNLHIRKNCNNNNNNNNLEYTFYVICIV